MPAKKRKNIALLISQLDRSYHSIIWHLVVSEIRRRGHNCFVFLGKSLMVPYGDDTQHNIIYSLADHQDLDGILLISGSLSTFLKRKDFQEFLEPLKQIPMVCTDMVNGFPSVIMDNRAGIKQVVHHLVEEHQFKKIFYISGPLDVWDAKERFEGFKEGLRDKGLPFNPDWVFYGRMDSGSGYKAGERILELGVDKIDAIVSANDDMMLTAMKYLQDRGYHFPDDAACFGFDDTREARVSLPALSSVSLPFKEQINQVLDLLFLRIEGKDVDSLITLNPELIPRQSCGCKEKNSYTVEEDQEYQVQEWMEQILSCCRKQREYPPRKGFLDDITELYYQFLRSEIPNELWLVLIEKARIILEEEADPEDDQCKPWEMLLQKAGILYYEVSTRELQRSSLMAEESLLDLQRISQSIITPQDYHALAGSIYYNFPDLGIHHMRMVLWDGSVQWDKRLKWTLPEQCELIAEMAPGVNFYSDKKQVFNTKDWIPAWIGESKTPTVHFILPLFFREEPFGYIIIEEGVNIDILYETLRGQISSAIEGIKLIINETLIAKKLKATVGELQESKKRIEQMSIVDELTGLYNRRGFVTLSRQELKLAKRKHREFLLIFMDLDGLKIINDTFGHKAGDEAISETGRQLKKTFRSTDIIARLGGDEFTVLAIDTTMQEYELIKDRLEKSVEEYNSSSPHPFTLSISMGCAPFSAGRLYKLEDLMAEADRKLYEAKRKKKEARKKAEGK